MILTQVSWSSTGGGMVAILDAHNPVRVPTESFFIKGHTAPVCEVKWSPFKSNLLATGSEDAGIKIWDIPQEGLTADITKEAYSLSGHQKKVANIAWHPTVVDLLASGSYDGRVNVWNFVTGATLHSFNFNDSVLSIDWNLEGSLIAVSSKDKLAHLVDPRANKTEFVKIFIIIVIQST